MAHSLEAFSPSSTRVHLIGVAGSGMSGLAWLFLHLGYRVSGCDRATSAETERLRQAGLEFFCPQTAESVQGADLVVFTSAVRAGNPAFDAATAAGVPLWRRAEALAAIMHRKHGVVVCGTHGKTTTSAMAAHVLREAGLHPSYYIGAEIPLLGSNAGWDPAGTIFVAEGDESDGTLVNFHPAQAIVLNIEAEHLDHYADLDAILRVFGALLSQTTSTVFFCADDAGAREACGSAASADPGRGVAPRHAGEPEGGTLQARSSGSSGRRFVSFGFADGADFRATGLTTLGQSTRCTVVRRGEPLGELVLNIPGLHNVSNALAVVALASGLGVPFERIRSALESFRGAKRRFEILYQSAAFRVVDDYGHHPSEIVATLGAARALNPGRLVVVFQPHRFTRTHLLRDQFGPAFAEADALFVTDVYAASEPAIPGVTGQTIIGAVNESCPRVETFSVPSVPTAHLTVGNFLRPGDLVLTLGAGNVHEVGTRLATDLRVLDGIAGALAEPGAECRLYEPMRRHTTLLIGGPAQYWIEPHTVAGFQRLVRHLREQGLPIRVVGRGSNLLVRDGGIRGAVVHPSRGEFADVRLEGDCLVAGAGARFQKLAMTARSAGLGGFEWMEGVPGNVGGGLRMNAGAMGSQTFDQVVSLRLIDAAGELHEKPREAITAHYRNTPELATHYAVSAVFRGAPAPLEAIDAALADSKHHRRASQPVAASAGCIFKNPDTCPAGRLIDELGLKNAAVGQARVSSVHGNFIVNEGGATASDVLALIDQIKAAARRQRGLDLETEVQIIGEEQAM